MRIWRVGIAPLRWRAQAEVLAAAAGFAVSPVTAMAASPLCPCPDVPETPMGPLLVGAGIAAAGLFAALGGRHRPGSRLRGLLARAAAVLSVVVLCTAVCVVYNASAAAVCVCSADPTPTPSSSATGSPTASPSGSPAGTPTPSPSASGRGAGFTRATGSSVQPLHRAGRHHGTAGLVVGVPSTGLPGLASWPAVVVLLGAAATGGSVVIKRRRAGL